MTKDSSEETPMSKDDSLRDLVERVEAKCRGSGSVRVCCHPDVDDSPVTSGDRACVLDTGVGAPGCDIAFDEKLKSKLDCPYWLPRPTIAPEPPTIEEALSLIASLRAHMGTEG